MLLASLRSTLHACCVEPVPLNAQNGGFLCGLYELDEAASKRRGMVVSYNGDYRECNSIETIGRPAN